MLAAGTCARALLPHTDLRSQTFADAAGGGGDAAGGARYSTLLCYVLAQLPPPAAPDGARADAVLASARLLLLMRDGQEL